MLFFNSQWPAGYLSNIYSFNLAFVHLRSLGGRLPGADAAAKGCQPFARMATSSLPALGYLFLICILMFELKSLRGQAEAGRGTQRQVEADRGMQRQFVSRRRVAQKSICFLPRQRSLGARSFLSQFAFSPGKEASGPEAF